MILANLFLCFACDTNLVSQIMSFWSSATEPKSDSCNKCQATSSTTAVWPVKIVLASITRFSLGVALMSHKQIVWSSEALSRYPLRFGFQERPYPSFWWPRSLWNTNNFSFFSSYTYFQTENSSRIWLSKCKRIKKKSKKIKKLARGASIIISLPEIGMAFPVGIGFTRMFSVIEH